MPPRLLGRCLDSICLARLLLSIHLHAWCHVVACLTELSHPARALPSFGQQTRRALLCLDIADSRNRPRRFDCMLPTRLCSAPLPRGSACKLSRTSRIATQPAGGSLGVPPSVFSRVPNHITLLVSLLHPLLVLAPPLLLTQLALQLLAALCCTRRPRAPHTFSSTHT